MILDVTKLIGQSYNFCKHPAGIRVENLLYAKKVQGEFCRGRI